MNKWSVIFDEERCKGCGICAGVCPKKIIELDEESLNSQGYHSMVIKNMDECIGCQSCAIMCPDLAITIFREDAK